MNNRTFLIPATLITILMLEGCAAVAGAGAASGAALIYDRRTAGTMVDDQTIEFKILDAIRQDAELWGQTHISATSYNNIVLLTGEAPDGEMRGRAESLVSRIPKVRKIHNEIAIAAPSSLLSRSSDTWITSKVKTNLITQDLEAGRIKVLTENGSVYLMGLVTRDEAKNATESARRVSGVQRVVKVFEYID